MVVVEGEVEVDEGEVVVVEGEVDVVKGVVGRSESVVETEGCVDVGLEIFLLVHVV